MCASGPLSSDCLPQAQNMAHGDVQNARIRARELINHSAHTTVLAGENEIRLARWIDRFLAWLVDMTIISIILGVVWGSVAGDSMWVEEDDLLFTWQHAVASTIFFAYWFVLEYKKGQSVGKRIFNLKVVDTDGRRPDIKAVLLSSFGKAFLLPIDLILGWIFTNKNRQRVFNRIGNTLVVRITSNDAVPYLKD